MNQQVAALRQALTDLPTWSRAILNRPLRPYQIEPAREIIQSIATGAGLTFTVMMSRQAGKNELSAHLESFLLASRQNQPHSMVKAAPTFKPQTINSMLRLATLLNNPLTTRRWKREHGYIIALGKCRILFFSAEPGASVVGATASLLLEIDEAQDVDARKHDKDFAPMAASTNATRVYYGTAWDDTTLLQRQIEANLEAERRDGRRRHFAYPWTVIAEHNPAYGAYVQTERDRLGADHPLFRTQYELRTIAGESGFFSPRHVAQLRGMHPRRSEPLPHAAYIAALDVAGGAEEAGDGMTLTRERRPDSTVLLLARVEWPEEWAEGDAEPTLSVEECVRWTGVDHRSQYRTLVDLCKNVWHVRRLAVDATGLGGPVADFLTGTLGDDVVKPVVFSAASKSQLGYDLLALVGAGRLKWYAHGDADGEAGEFWHEVAECRFSVRPNRQMRFFVPEGRGHDDMVMALALLTSVAKDVPPAAASAVVPNVEPGYSRRWNGEF